MMEQGGTASCKQLATIYGGHTSSYIGSSVNLGKRVKKFFNLPRCMDGDQERFFVYPFFGKAIDDETGHSYIYKMRPELIEALKEIDLTHVNPMYEEGETIMVNRTDISKNTILFGPPGTGKTYQTINYAVAIIEGVPLKNIQEESREEVVKRLKKYKEAGQVETVTFHQSYGYEDFIEGIRPKMKNEDDESENKEVQYEVKPGAFKAFCDEARKPSVKKDKDIGLNSAPTIWKVSLEGTGQNPTRTECMKNGHIRVGYDGYGANITPETDFSKYGGKNVLNALYTKMKIGDIVFSCFSNTNIDAIGVVTGDVEWHNEYENYKRLRKVNWIVKGINENIVDFNGGTTMTLSSVYKLSVSVSDALTLIDKNQANNQILIPNDKRYVFIIDEINRGNISKIFGELITLVEESKRIGQPEETKVKLPYSPTPFGVPDNIYLIGTMNTADRSIATIDTALRRRFQFRELQPEVKVLKEVIIDGLSIDKLLFNMNRKIEILYDREHTIGHAYFIPLKESPTIDMLEEIFKNQIMPLLQEYFYDDYQKIQLVLGDNKKLEEDKKFIVEKTHDWNSIFGAAEFDEDDAVTYSLNEKAFHDIDAYRYI